MPLQRPVKLALGSVLAALFAAGAAVGGAAVWTAASASGRLFRVDAVPAHDVAIILGAQVYSDGTPAPFTAARLDVGVALYQAGKAKVLVVSGNNSAEHHHETTSMRRYLADRGVPASKIVEDVAGNDTYDTCIRARDVFGIDAAIMVSQTYHLPRAITACQGLGVDAVGVGDDSVKDLDFWPVGVAREYPANIKLAYNLLTKSAPEVTEPPSDAVRVALES